MSGQAREVTGAPEHHRRDRPKRLRLGRAHRQPANRGRAAEAADRRERALGLAVPRWGPAAPNQTWRTFLRNHRPTLWACDQLIEGDALRTPAPLPGARQGGRVGVRLRAAGSAPGRQDGRHAGPGAGDRPHGDRGSERARRRARRGPRSGARRAVG